MIKSPPLVVDPEHFLSDQKVQKFLVNFLEKKFTTHEKISIFQKISGPVTHFFLSVLAGGL